MKLIPYKWGANYGGYEVWNGRYYLGLIITDYGDYTCVINTHTVASSDKLWKAKILFRIKYFLYTLFMK